jgi:hypothetical protein
MAQPLRPKQVYGRIKENRAGVRREQRKPVLPGPYVYVSGGTGDVAPLETWQSVPWLNNFTQYGTSYCGFRHGLDGFTEFIGQIDLTAGAVTGTVAFRLPVPWRAISFDYVFPIFSGGVTWESGIMSINGDSTDTANWGKVTVYWPVQMTP